MRAFALLFFGVVVGWAAGGVDWSREAVGDETYDRIEPSENSEGGKPYTAPPTQIRERLVGDANGRFMKIRENVFPPALGSNDLVGRFQASAYGSPSGHGCYVVDTMTGQTWHILNGRPPQIVASGLTPYAPQPAMPTPADQFTPPLTPTYQSPPEPQIER